MALEKGYSNPRDQVKRLQTLLELPRSTRPRVPKMASKQAQKRLDAEEVARLVAEHQAGVEVKQLARQFGVHRGTVTDILQREGAHRTPGIVPGDLPAMIRLYEEGWSLARLGERFHVAPDTVGRALHAEGVKVRPPGGRRRTSSLVDFR